MAVKVLGGKCGCPSVLCKGTVERGEPGKQFWKTRTNKRGHYYGRGKRMHKRQRQQGS